MDKKKKEAKTRKETKNNQEKQNKAFSHLYKNSRYTFLAFNSSCKEARAENDNDRTEIGNKRRKIEKIDKKRRVSRESIMSNLTLGRHGN